MARKKEEEGKKGLPEWQATYGDMVTLLLCFFVLLFSMSSVDAAKFQQIAASFSSNPISVMENSSQGMLDALGNGIVQMPEVKGDSEKESQEYREAQEELTKMTSDFKTYFADNNLQDKIDVEQNEQYITLNFKDGILFDSGKDDIRPEALPVLDMVANELLKYPENEIKIEGHTDNRPINTVRFPSNWHLSASRAISVAEYFINTKSFDPSRISADGFGEYRPKVSNDTPENRATNRRVEIKIMSKYNSEDLLNGASYTE